MFTAALFTIAKTWKQPKWMNGLKSYNIYIYVCIYIHTCIYIYIMQYYSAIKFRDTLSFTTTWMDLEGIMLSEISQTEKDKYSRSCLYKETLKKKKKRKRKERNSMKKRKEIRLVITRGRG